MTWSYTVIIPLAIAHYSFVLQPGLRRKNITMIWLVIILSLVLISLLGSRFMTLEYVFIGIVSTSYRRQISDIIIENKKYAILFSIIFLIYFTLISIIRYWGYGSIIDYKHILLNRIFFAEAASQAFAIDYFLSGQISEYLNGATFFPKESIWFGWTHAIFWPNGFTDPLMLELDLWTGDMIYDGAKTIYGRNISAHPGLLAELLFNFGWAGILLFSVWGYLLQLYYIVRVRSNRVSSYPVSAYITIMLGSTINSGVYHTLIFILYALFIWYALNMKIYDVFKKN